MFEFSWLSAFSPHNANPADFIESFCGKSGFNAGNNLARCAISFCLAYKISMEKVTATEIYLYNFFESKHTASP